MATVLFIIADYFGHLHSTYQIARSLRARGHRVVYLGSDKMRAEVCSHGFAFDVAPFIEPLPAGDKLWEGSHGPLRSLRHNFLRIRELRLTARRKFENLRHIPAQVREVIQRYRPDLIVFDPFLLMYYPPFHAEGIPAVAISIFPLFDQDPWVPPYTSDLIPGRGFTAEVRVKLAWVKCYLQYAKYKTRSYCERVVTGLSARAMIERLAQEVEFDFRSEWRTRPLYFDCKFRSVPELVLHAECFDFRRKKALPQNTYYAGPCVDLERSEEEFSWDEIEFRERLIFCALGTVTKGLSDKQQFLRRLIEVARKRSNYSFIVATGAIDRNSISDLPPNVYVYAFVPQLRMLRKAQVMIHHGGANSTKECVFAGVPMLVYPVRADQPGNSARVVFHGIGLRGSIKNDSVADIDSKIERLLTDSSFRLNVERMRQQFIKSQQAQKGVEFIEQLIEAGQRVDQFADVGMRARQ